MRQRSKSKIKILVIHGPNLNLLGRREPHIYGNVTLQKINDALSRIAKKRNVILKILQSNEEGKIVDAINKAVDKFAGILINPAGYTHTSVAIRDAIASANIPTIEVHLSNIYMREEFRRHSIISPVCKGQICGFGMKSYLLGLEALIDLLKNNKDKC